MTEEIPVTVVGFVLTSISVLAAYNLFLIQSWLNAVAATVQETRTLAAAKSMSEFAREEARSLLDRMKWRFPVIQTVILWLAVGGLTTINVVAARRMSLSSLFTTAPALILDCVIVLAAIGAIVMGGLQIHGAVRLLG